MNNTYEEARKKMFANAVSVRITPIDLPDEPMSEWEWNVEIIIPNNQWENSDEDGNFIVEMCGIHSFYSLEEAFEWAYTWLKGRGYDVSNIDLNMTMIGGGGIIHQSDINEVMSARIG